MALGLGLLSGTVAGRCSAPKVDRALEQTIGRLAGDTMRLGQAARDSGKAAQAARRRADSLSAVADTLQRAYEAAAGRIRIIRVPVVAGDSGGGSAADTAYVAGAPYPVPHAVVVAYDACSLALGGCREAAVAESLAARRAEGQALAERARGDSLARLAQQLDRRPVARGGHFVAGLAVGAGLLASLAGMLALVLH